MKRPDETFSDPSVEEWASYIAWALGEHTSRAGAGWSSKSIIIGLGIADHVVRKAMRIVDCDSLLDSSTGAYGITTYAPFGYEFQRRHMTDKQYRVCDVIRGNTGLAMSMAEIARLAQVQKGGAPYQLENLERQGLIVAHRVGYANHGKNKNTYTITPFGLSLMQHEDDAIRLGYATKSSEVFDLSCSILNQKRNGEVCDKAV